MQEESIGHTSARAGPAPIAAGRRERWVATADRVAGSVFILPAVLVVLFLSIFPLIVSLYLSLSRFKFVPGGFEFAFVGLANYRKLFLGSERNHFLGVMSDPSPLGWVLITVLIGLMGWGMVRYISSRSVTPVGLVGRILGFLFISALILLIVRTIFSEGRPGTLVVTLVYVFAGIAVQYLLGLGLALLVTRQLPGRRFFRVVYLLPMMITPAGVAYLFRMLTDTGKGPFHPIWFALGLGDYSWVNEPWGARVAVMIGDTWQWTPFMFIVLLAAIEGQSREIIEAALVDGATRWQSFWYVTLPQILPVSTTLILIRMIEAFKIVDLPNILTQGGPGTATESLTLHSFIAWRTLDLGGSAAVAYVLLLTVTIIGIAYVNLLRQRVAEA